MSTFLSVVMLRGRLTRWPYAFVAVPILLLMESGHIVAYLAPLIFQKLGGGLGDMAGLTWFFMGYNALVLPLFIVSFNRLHDLRLTGWLALPYLVGAASRLMIGWVAAYQHYANLSFQNTLTLSFQFCYVYSIILALTLLVVPGRKVSVCPLPVNS